MTEIKYEQSGLNKKILRAVGEMGYRTMTPIQAEAMPVLLEGRDVIGQAQTGTGKTAAFGIPLLTRIDPSEKAVQALVLCPTRELAMQAASEIRKFAKFMHGISVAAVYGGTDMRPQIRAIRTGTQAIVGTPGRVMDLMRRHILKLDHIKIVVLDEADEMLDMGFREDMETILNQIEQPHQTALFSATMPQAILDITKQFQKDAVFVKMPDKELTVEAIKQYYVVCKDEYKTEVIRRLKERHALQRSLIFCNTKRMVDLLADDLQKMGYRAEGLHGDLEQEQRDQVMKHFRAGKLDFLIATDVAARGIDVSNLDAVFNYDAPQDTDFYVHRIGRTGRAGKEGIAFTLINGKEMNKIRDIEHVCKTTIERYSLSEQAGFDAGAAKRILTETAQNLKTEDIAEIKKWLEKNLRGSSMKALDLSAALLKERVQTDSNSFSMDEMEDTVRQYGQTSEGGNRRKRREHKKDTKHTSLYEDSNYLATFERPGRINIMTRGEAAEHAAIQTYFSKTADPVPPRVDSDAKAGSRRRRRRKTQNKA